MLEALVDQIAGQVLLVQALLDGDDAASGLVVEAGEEGLLVIVPDPGPLGLRAGIGGLHQIVDDDEIGPEAGHRPAQRDRLAAAQAGGDQLQIGAALEPGAREQLPVPVRFHHRPAVAPM